MTIEQKLAALKALRGKQDQTIRTQVIHIVYGPTTERVTETNRFLEAEIRRLEKSLHMAYADALS